MSGIDAVKALYFDKLINNRNATCSIAISNITTPANQFNNPFGNNLLSRPLTFFLGGSVGFNGANQFEAPLEGVFNDINRLARVLNVVVSETELKNLGLPNFQVRTDFDTTLQWIISERKSFSIPVFFVRWRQGQSIKDYLKILSRATSPESRTVQFKGNNVNLLTAPGDYQVNEQGVSGGGGICAVRIGQFFEVDRMVLSNYHLTPSLETTPDGEPLYIEGSITVQAQKIFTADEVDNWYK